MIFVDTNVFIYAVGKTHPLKSRARAFFNDALHNSRPLCTSAEVLQELMHVFLNVGRKENLAGALGLVRQARIEVWSLEKGDVELALVLYEQFPMLAARDLCHLASSRRRGVGEFMTFDKRLEKVGNEVLRGV